MTDIVLAGLIEQSRGVIGREPDADERYIFPTESVKPRLVHMVGVRVPLRVTWKIRGEVVATEVLEPWTGWAIHRGDTIIEEAVGE